MKKLIIFVISLSLILCGCGATPFEQTMPEVNEKQETYLSTTEPAATEPAATAPLGTPENPYPPGMYKIGSDLPAGEYFLAALDDGGGYYCVSSDSNKEDIIENDIFSNHTFITVSEGQYFDVSRACFVLSDGYTVRISDNGSLRPGMYRVGLDIPAGEYKLDATDSLGYYCIYTDSVAPLDIVDNDLFENTAYVTVSDGQYLSLNDCIGIPVK